MGEIATVRNILYQLPPQIHACDIREIYNAEYFHGLRLHCHGSKRYVCGRTYFAFIEYDLFDLFTIPFILSEFSKKKLYVAKVRGNRI